jgi:hypothetical protein
MGTWLTTDIKNINCWNRIASYTPRETSHRKIQDFYILVSIFSLDLL